MMNKMKRAAWALLLAVALVLTSAMAEGVSADLVEAPAEEAGELLLDMSVPEEAAAQTVPKEAPAPEPVEVVSKANYEPATYSLEVSKSISGNESSKR